MILHFIIQETSLKVQKQVILFISMKQDQVVSNIDCHNFANTWHNNLGIQERRLRNFFFDAGGPD